MMSELNDWYYVIAEEGDYWTVLYRTMSGWQATVEAENQRWRFMESPDVKIIITTATPRRKKVRNG